MTLAIAAVPPATISPCTNADYPFNKTSADAILRSSDSVDFWVRRSILAEASLIFEDMLSMPQPSPGSAHCDEIKDGLPVIQLAEDSVTLDQLLRLCYPTEDPEIDSLEDIKAVLRAALKYMMQESITLLRKRLVKLGQSQPLRAFAIACSLDLEIEVQALAPLAYSVHGSYVEELRDISAGVYYRISHYMPRRESVATKQKDRGGSENVAFSSRPPQVRGKALSLPNFGDKDTVSATLQDMPMTDLTIRTLDNIDFRVHSAILSLASPFLEKLISHQTDTCGVFCVSEDSSTLSLLLRYIYPLERPSTWSLHMLKSVLAAASKYQLTSVLTTLRSSLATLLPRQNNYNFAAIKAALRVFALAHQFGFRDERAAASRVLLDLSSHDLQNLYVEELEDIPASAYFRLLEYHDKCGQAAAAHVLSHALECTTTTPASAPLSPASPRHTGPSQTTPSHIGTRFFARSFACSPPGSPPSTDPQAVLITPRSHSSLCHVVLDDTSLASWAHFRTQSTPRWWLMYVYKLATVLRHRPAPRLALDRGLRERAFARALECECCRGVFLVGFQDYVEGLRGEVEKVIARVKLDI